jgi:hypothetical protein
MNSFPIMLAAAFLAAPALASGPGESHAGKGTDYIPNGVFGYEVFEASVAHADLVSCPASFDENVVFCRMTLANEQAHVFVFSFDGDQPLLAVKHYDLDDELLPF